MKQYKLFIDETGHPHQNHNSSHFTLMGIIVEDGKQSELKIRADQLRFKYWNKTNIVFHSEELGRRAGDYGIFKNSPQLAVQFENQLLDFLYKCPVMLVSAVVDKKRAYKVGWKEDTIITKASESLVMDFLAFLYGQDNAQGRVVYETSGSTRDNLYLKAFHRYLDPGWENKHSEYFRVREHLTSITFASKLNHDTEMQLADIFSYAAVCRHRQLGKVEQYSKESYEQKLISILNKKVLSMRPGVTKKTKRKYYSHIKGIAMYPEIKPKTQQKKKTA